MSPSATNQSSPAARKLQLNFEGGLKGTVASLATEEVEGAFSSPGQSQATWRYEPRGAACDGVGIDSVSPLAMTLMQVAHQDMGTSPMPPHAFMAGTGLSPSSLRMNGKDAFVGKIESLKGQVSQLHR